MNIRQRKGSGAAYYNIFGWDVEEFLDSKKINASEKTRIPTLSIGLIIPQKFYELAEKNKPYYIFAPHTVFKEYGQHLCDMDLDSNLYEELIMNENVKKKKLNAREMLSKIAQTQLESGYPYIMNKSNANKFHALKDIGEVKMSNLCNEIYNLQEISEINDYETPDIIRRDVNCNLGSLNIVNVMEYGNLRESVHTATIALDSVARMTNIKDAPSVKLANYELVSIGLGAMNLHGFLAKNKIAYESNEAREFADVFFAAMNFYSLEASMELSKKHGAFKDFNKSEYAKGTYFEKYINKNFLPVSDKVKKLFENFNLSLPSKKDWKELKEKVKTHGLANAYRIALAPTQSISYVQNSTSSVMPVVEHIETRSSGKSITYYPMPFLSQDNFFFYKSAYNINQFKLIDLISTIQEHVDQGISTILHINSDISTKELARYYVYASKKNLKGLYYSRTKRLNVADCTACQV